MHVLVMYSSLRGGQETCCVYCDSQIALHYLLLNVIVLSGTSGLQSISAQFVV